jgi:hypothetical protein
MINISGWRPWPGHATDRPDVFYNPIRREFSTVRSRGPHRITRLFGTLCEPERYTWSESVLH